MDPHLLDEDGLRTIEEIEPHLLDKDGPLNTQEILEDHIRNSWPLPKKNIKNQNLPAPVLIEDGNEGEPTEGELPQLALVLFEIKTKKLSDFPQEDLDHYFYSNYDCTCVGRYYYAFRYESA